MHIDTFLLFVIFVFSWWFLFFLTHNDIISKYSFFCPCIYPTAKLTPSLLECCNHHLVKIGFSAFLHSWVLSLCYGSDKTVKMLLLKIIHAQEIYILYRVQWKFQTSMAIISIWPNGGYSTLEGRASNIS